MMLAGTFPVAKQRSRLRRKCRGEIIEVRNCYVSTVRRNLPAAKDHETQELEVCTRRSRDPAVEGLDLGDQRLRTGPSKKQRRSEHSFARVCRDVHLRSPPLPS